MKRLAPVEKLAISLLWSDIMQGESESWWSWCLEAEAEAEAARKLEQIPGSQWNQVGNKPTVLHGRISRGRRRPKAKASVDKDLEKIAFRFGIKTNIQKPQPAHVPEKKLSALTKERKKERKATRKQVFCQAKGSEKKATNHSSPEYTKQKVPSRNGIVHKKVSTIEILAFSFCRFFRTGLQIHFSGENNANHPCTPLLSDCFSLALGMYCKRPRNCCHRR